MPKLQQKMNHKGAEEARNQLPALLADAANGRTTLITRHGRTLAAIVPADSIVKAPRQAALSALAGSGKGLWGRNTSKTIRQLRDEWSR